MDDYLIEFKPLTSEHYDLLLKWLKLPYIKQWWDPDISWTHSLIKQKYENYTRVFKRLKLNDQISKSPCMHILSILIVL